EYQTYQPHSGLSHNNSPFWLLPFLYLPFPLVYHKSGDNHLSKIYHSHQRLSYYHSDQEPNRLIPACFHQNHKKAYQSLHHTLYDSLSENPDSCYRATMENKCERFQRHHRYNVFDPLTEEENLTLTPRLNHANIYQQYHCC